MVWMNGAHRIWIKAQMLLADSRDRDRERKRKKGEGVDEKEKQRGRGGWGGGDLQTQFTHSQRSLLTQRIYILISFHFVCFLSVHMACHIDFYSWQNEIGTAKMQFSPNYLLLLLFWHRHEDKLMAIWICSFPEWMNGEWIYRFSLDLHSEDHLKNKCAQWI